MKEFIKKHWFIIIFILLSVIRFLFTFNLPNFYLRNMAFDDLLMINMSTTIKSGIYLGNYNNMTLIKGFMYAYLLVFSRNMNISMTIIITVLYIASSAYFLYSLSKIVKNKKYLIIIYAFILFNPISYSSDLLQRLYRNALSLPELLFFLGAIINFLYSKKNLVLNAIFLGFIAFLMYMTREDTIWTYPVLMFIYGYKIILWFYKKKKHKDKFKIKYVLISILPILTIVIGLNLVRMQNFNYYYTYTYNELNDSPFKTAYRKILEIKDEEKIDKVSIPRSTLHKLAQNSKVLAVDEETFEEFYERFEDKDTGEINNGNMVWYFRNLVNKVHNLKNGRQANEFYKDLANEMDELFEKGVFEKEIVSPSTYIYMPIKNELKEIPKSVVKAVIYTSTYKNVKALTYADLFGNEMYQYNTYTKLNSLSYKDYRNTENIPQHNRIRYEVFRLFYKYFTIIFSFIALFLYLKNIRKLDTLNIIIHIIVISYITILLGISYNNATAFPSIRYLYLGNNYVLQTLFILLNLLRLDKISKYTIC